MPANKPPAVHTTETGSAAAGAPKPEAGQEDKNQRYWFHILRQDTPAARNLHAAKLV